MKLVYKYDQKEMARMFFDAIKEIANKPENMKNLEAYLSLHFTEWMEKYAGDPANLAGEMHNFATMEI